jgi:tripartite-type tricarboxylate transporter receptor subunit TctC
MKPATSCTRSIAAAVMACALLPAMAQTYPNKPIRFIAAFPPGGGSDVVGRTLFPKMSEMFGQQLFIENRSGAGGNIGADYAAKASPDGYTFFIANNTVVTNPALAKTPYDVVRDFAPVSMVGSTAVAVAVHPSFPAKSIAELTELARREPGKHAYSSCGSGGAMHLAGELYKLIAKIDINHISYRGCAPAVVDGIGGQVPILFNTITNTHMHAKAGKLRILALASATRSPVDQSIPIISESAGFEGFDADIWFGILAPAGTPRAIVVRMNEAINKTLQMPEIQERFAAQLFAVRGSTPEEFGAIIKSDVARWAKLVKDANIRAD